MMGNIETRLFKMYVGWHFIAGINRRYDPKYTHNFWGLKGILCSITVGCNEHLVNFFWDDNFFYPLRAIQQREKLHKSIGP